MVVLVDYDNVDRTYRQGGATLVIDRILQSLVPLLGSEKAIGFRLYGGWFDGSSYSRSAQAITPELRQFPKTHKIGTSTVIVRAELALGLAAEPNKPLSHTFRKRPLTDQVRCVPLPFSGCANPATCGVPTTVRAIKTRTCALPSCSVSTQQLIYQEEQKLVDTMLTVDVLHFARAKTDRVVVVSSDEDMWPGIQAAVKEGADLIHLHPKHGMSTPLHYVRNASKSYVEVSF